MNRKYFYMRGVFLLVFVLCTLKSFIVFLSLDNYELNGDTSGSVKASTLLMTNGSAMPKPSMDTVVENLKGSEDIFHQLVHQFYKKYNSYYRPKLSKALNTSKLTNVIDKSGIIPICDGQPFLLIQVHSASINVKKRLAIRHSWGARTAHAHGGLHVRTVFVVGRSRLRNVDDIILSEAREYNDMLVTEFFDSYRRLSHKTLMALKWADNYCRPNYMLKTDDDCYVNIPNILKFLAQRNNSILKNQKVNPLLSEERSPSNISSVTTDNLYTGRIQWFMPTNRNKSSKFYTSEREYAELIYPPYASGGGYLFAGGLIPQLVNASSRLSIIPNEDAYFGTLMHAINIKPTENQLMLPFIYCNQSMWDRPACDFTYPYVIHGVLNYAQIWIHYHVTVLSSVPGICKQSFKRRNQLDIPLYCYTDFT